MNATPVPTVGSPLRMVWAVPTDNADGAQLTCGWISACDHAGTESPAAMAA